MACIAETTCTRCGKKFFTYARYVNICPICLQAEEDEKLKNFLIELWKGRDTKQVVEELAKIVYHLQHKKPEYVPPPVFY